MFLKAFFPPTLFFRKKVVQHPLKARYPLSLLKILNKTLSARKMAEPLRCFSSQTQNTHIPRVLVRVYIVGLR